jgi:hypothetical protein
MLWLAFRLHLHLRLQPQCHARRSVAYDPPHPSKKGPCHCLFVVDEHRFRRLVGSQRCFLGGLPTTCWHCPHGGWHVHASGPQPTPTPPQVGPTLTLVLCSALSIRCRFGTCMAKNPKERLFKPHPQCVQIEALMVCINV